MRTSNRFLFVFAVFSLAACSSSESSAPATTTADDCTKLSKECDACSDATLKQACLSSVITYKGGGETGQKACKAAIEAKTYSGDSCANQCALLKQGCDACMNTQVKASCNEIVTANKSDDCKAYLSSGVLSQTCGSP